MTKRGNAQIYKQKNHNKQYDRHCWQYYFVKFSSDYTLQNRQRVLLSPVNRRLK